MSDPMPASAPGTPPNQTTQRRRRSWRPSVSVVGACAAVSGAVVIVLQLAAGGDPSSKSTSHRAARSDIAASAVVPHAAADAASASSSSASLTDEKAAPETPPPVAIELADVKASHERQSLRFDAAEERIQGLQDQLTALTERLDKVDAAHAEARRREKIFARRSQRSRVAVVQSPPKEPPPQVLSVDTWNGRPSVAVRVGSEVRFASDGEAVGGAIVRNPDPAARTAELVEQPSATAASTGAAGATP